MFWLGALVGGLLVTSWWGVWFHFRQGAIVVKLWDRGWRPSGATPGSEEWNAECREFGCCDDRGSA